MRVTFSDGQGPSYCSQDCIKNAMWNNADSVANVINEASFGKVTFPWQKAKVIDVTLPKSPGQYTGCDTANYAADAAAVAKQSGVTVENYDHQVYYIADLAQCPGWGGLGDIGGAQSFSKVADAKVVLHELGHNIGMLHSKSPCAEYGDESDVMGNGPAGFSMPHRVFMGWVNVNTLPSVTASCAGNPASYIIRPASKANVNSMAGTVPGVRLPDTLSGGVYTLSVRDRSGFDSALDAKFVGTVSMHYCTRSASSAYNCIAPILVQSGGANAVIQTSMFKVTVGAVRSDGAVSVAVTYCVDAMPAAEWLNKNILLKSAVPGIGGINLDCQGNVIVDPSATGTTNDQSWRMLPSLSQTFGYVRFESVGQLGQYITSESSVAKLTKAGSHTPEHTVLSCVEASYKPVAVSSGIYKFESERYPGRFLGYDGAKRIVLLADTSSAVQWTVAKSDLIGQ